MRNIITAVLSLLFISCVGINICLELHYASSLPKVSDIQTGHVYQMTVNHGFVVYGTREEFRLLTVARRCFPLAGACFVALFVLKITETRLSGRTPASKPSINQ